MTATIHSLADFRRRQGAQACTPREHHGAEAAAEQYRKRRGRISLRLGTAPCDLPCGCTAMCPRLIVYGGDCWIDWQETAAGTRAIAAIHPDCFADGRFGQ